MRLKKRAGASLARQPRRVQPPPEGSGKSLVGDEGPQEHIGLVARHWQASFVQSGTSLILGDNPEWRSAGSWLQRFSPVGRGGVEAAWASRLRRAPQIKVTNLCRRARHGVHQTGSPSRRPESSRAGIGLAALGLRGLLFGLQY